MKNHYSRSKFQCGSTAEVLKIVFPGRWCFLKCFVYVHKPETLETLKENIQPQCKNILPAVLAKVMQNAVKRGGVYFYVRM